MRLKTLVADAPNLHDPAALIFLIGQQEIRLRLSELTLLSCVGPLDLLQFMHTPKSSRDHAVPAKEALA